MICTLTIPLSIKHWRLEIRMSHDGLMASRKKKKCEGPCSREPIGGVRFFPQRLIFYLRSKPQISNVVARNLKEFLLEVIANRALPHVCWTCNSQQNLVAYLDKCGSLKAFKRPHAD